MLVDICAYLLIGSLGVMGLAAGSVGIRCFCRSILRVKISPLSPFELIAGWFGLVATAVMIPICFLVSGKAFTRRSDRAVTFSDDPLLFVAIIAVTTFIAGSLIYTTVITIRWFRAK